MKTENNENSQTDKNKNTKKQNITNNKKKVVKKPTVPKNVCGHSVKLSDEELLQISKVFEAYGLCADLFYTRFSSVQYMIDVKSWFDVRNKVRSEQHQINDARKELKKIESGKIQVDEKEYNHIKARAKNKTLNELFNIQGRHWVMALKQVCTSLNSTWSNLALKEKTMVRDNKNEDFTDEMKSYCYYVLSVRELWQQVLTDKPLHIKNMKTIDEIRSHLTDKQIKRCNQYIKRLTKRYKPHPKTHKHTYMLYDQEMYELIPTLIKGKKHEDKVVTRFQFMSNIPKAQFKVFLRSEFCYRPNGDIQIILNPRKKRLDIN